MNKNKTIEFVPDDDFEEELEQTTIEELEQEHIVSHKDKRVSVAWED